MNQALKKPTSIDIKALIYSFVLLLALFLLDQITKDIALKNLALGESTALFETKPVSLFLTLVTNTGAAWGAFSLSPRLLLSVRIVVVIALSLLWRRVHSLSSKLCVATVLAGALANILDFFLYGAVIDFIHVRFWNYNYPVFNIADCAIFLGTFGLMWKLLRTKES